MSFLLKIVQGPNAGAEIALVEGVNLSFGSADDCDIILSDSSVAEKAFELEVTGERVTAIMPDGKAVKLEPYHVSAIGTSAVVVGPQEGAWKELVWPRPEKPEAPAGNEEQEETVAAPAPPAKRRFCGCLLFVIVVLAALAAGGYGYWKHPEIAKAHYGKAKERAVSAWTFVSEKLKAAKAPAVVAAPKESLDKVARECGFAVGGTAAKPVAKGDFATRVARLEATARAYAAQPGLAVDFTDAESLSVAVNELLAMVSDGRLRLDRIEGRKVFLSGFASSSGALEAVLRALSDDVPKITEADCSGVNVGGVEASVADDAGGGDEKGKVRYNVPKMKKGVGEAKSSKLAGNPEMPVVGVLTVPYPCLVLGDGTRAMEGARFGEFVIEKIEADRVTVRHSDGSFEWRP